MREVMENIDGNALLVMENIDGNTLYPVNSTMSIFIQDLITMTELYNEGEYDSAEWMRDKLKEELDNVMRGY